MVFNYFSGSTVNFMKGKYKRDRRPRPEEKTVNNKILCYCLIQHWSFAF